MPVSFECITQSSRKLSDLFDRARDIGLHEQSQSGSGERALGEVTTGLIGLNQEVTFSGKHLGLRFSLTSRVTEFDAPRRFVDEQRHGPFKAFRHEHLFAAVPSGTRMTDRVVFTAPLGPVGWVAERVFLSRYLKQLIRDRGAFLAA
jgi:ligand-binding SRPBCC domain-containing protein